MDALSLLLALAPCAEHAREVAWLPPFAECRRQFRHAEKYYSACDDAAFFALCPRHADAWHAAGVDAAACMDWWGLACQAHRGDFCTVRYRRDGACSWSQVAGSYSGDPFAALRCLKERLGPAGWVRQDWPPALPYWRVPYLEHWPRKFPPLAPPEDPPP